VTRRRQGGFTLIEMMIAMVMFALVFAVTVQVTVTITNDLRATREAQAAERGTRSSIDYVADVIRAASAGAPAADLRDASFCTAAAPIAVENHTDAPDSVTVVYGMAGGITSLRSVFTAASTSLDVRDATGISPGDAVIVTDGTTARLVTVGAISAATGQATIDTPAPASACPAVTWPQDGFQIGSVVLRGRAARFFVADASDGTPMLWMDPDADGPAEAEPLAEGIEDMQIAIGVDLDGDGILRDDGSDTDEWFYNAPGDADPPDPTVKPWAAIRISMVARTMGDRGPVPVSARPALEDRAAGTMDIHRRRVLSSVVEIRNLEANP